MDESRVIRISLRENGLHSWWRGFDAFAEYQRNHDKLMLKDAIVFLHHGIELLMKEILQRNNSYLIFDDLADAAKKQLKANEQNIGIFFLDVPPKTVTYEEAIQRVHAFMGPELLTRSLRADLVRLNRLRNQLEHYELEVDEQHVTNLLGSIHPPLVRLFESYLGSIKREHAPSNSRLLKNIEAIVQTEQQLVNQVVQIMRRFDGRQISGRLFNRDEDVVLPRFDRILREDSFVADKQISYIDIHAVGQTCNWIVEVKGKTREDSVKKGIVQLNRYMSLLSYGDNGKNYVLWVVFAEQINDRIRTVAREAGVFVSGISELEELERVLTN